MSQPVIPPQRAKKSFSGASCSRDDMRVTFSGGFSSVALIGGCSDNGFVHENMNTTRKRTRAQPLRFASTPVAARILPWPLTLSVDSPTLHYR